MCFAEISQVHRLLMKFSFICNSSVNDFGGSVGFNPNLVSIPVRR